MPDTTDDEYWGLKETYEVLGVDPDAPEPVIRGAVRQLKKEHHPDRGGDPQEFQRVVEAGEALLEGNHA